MGYHAPQCSEWCTHDVARICVIRPRWGWERFFIHSFWIFIWHPFEKPSQRRSQSSYGQREMSYEACRKKTRCSGADTHTRTRTRTHTYAHAHTHLHTHTHTY